ncbi:D-isomer specific 2-hydroxyacid dehydrogenase [Coniella lustricola]|uniref:D-isomer specific 2-hydroxyacid dehydrogenase n=1 Tax=Coniella lustricola TaxID=2025994 RepID=A0A2T3A8E5_9PEZI|nr:D-isomer specific 2-hydroxyacid dehydrogenase [Coniella lustricola]
MALAQAQEATADSTSTKAAKDILLMLYPAPRKTAWEESVLKQHGDKLEIRWATTQAADGRYLKPADQDPAIFKDVTIYFSYLPAPAELVPKLKFVQTSSAGTDLWHDHPKYQDKNVVFCTSSGTQAPQIAEWVLGTWLRHRNDFPRYEELQTQGVWKPVLPDEFIADSIGARVGILGYGAIGRQVARACSAFGMQVLAFTSTPRLTPESRRDRAYCVPGLGDPEGLLPAQWFHGTTKHELNSFLAQGLDMLVISLPLTPATHQYISRDQLDVLSEHKTFVVNVARGPIVDTEALMQALEEGKIRGAALDVTDPEPLPQGHPLWKARNCFVTPHVSYHSTTQQKRVLDLLALNLDRFFSGRQLVNELKR